MILLSISSAATTMQPMTQPSYTSSWDATNWRSSMSASGRTISSPTSMTMTRTAHATNRNSFRTTSSTRTSSDTLLQSSNTFRHISRISKNHPTSLKLSPTISKILEESQNTWFTDGLLSSSLDHSFHHFFITVFKPFLISLCHFQFPRIHHILSKGCAPRNNI